MNESKNSLPSQNEKNDAVPEYPIYLKLKKRADITFRIKIGIVLSDPPY